MVVDSTVLSVVVPMFNEEAVIPALVARLRPSLDRLDVRYEVVAVDDVIVVGTAALFLEVGRTVREMFVVMMVRIS